MTLVTPSPSTRSRKPKMLAYQGEPEQWEFAIYRYSQGSYGDLPLAPTQGKAADLVDLALRAYNLR